MRRQSMKRKARNQRGNLLVIIVVVICLILIPLLIVQSQMGLYMVNKDKIQNVVEAACLVAANDLSRVIINDSHFGYVSLSNYAPIGEGTCAPDGEPLPVISINDLTGTIRQNSIIARELGNSTMTSLAANDRRYLSTTMWKLNAALKNACLESPSPSIDCKDIHGKKVELCKDVRTFLERNMPPGYELKSIKLTNGWLVDGNGTSATPTPKPDRFAYLKKGMERKGEYKPFVNVPFADESYTFAGVGASSSIVSAALFRKADNKHISSIVQLQCEIAKKDSLPAMGMDLGDKMSMVACCQPYSIPDNGPKGVMTLRFTGTPVSGLQSWSDLLNSGTFHDRRVSTFKANKGDFPLDQGSRMRKCAGKLSPSTSQQFAEHFYCWLRNGHLSPTVGGVIDMISRPFKEGKGAIYAFEFTRDGAISCRVLQRDPFPVGATADSQMSATADTRIQGGLTPVIIFRDNVRYLGTQYGGKHAGQPLAGSPLNWCELSEYGGDEKSAEALGKGRLATRLMVSASPSSNSQAGGVGDFCRDIFSHFDGKSLARQPRRSYYSGGLAVDIEIGGIMQSDAAKTVALMRSLPR